MRNWYCGLAQAGVARIQPVRSSQEHGLDRHDLADGAVVDPLHGLLPAAVPTALKAGEDTQLLGSRQGAGRFHPADANRVDAVRLLHENVLARLDRRLGIHRVELGRAGDQHNIDIFDHVLVAVETDEAVVLGDIDLVGELPLQVVAAGIEPVAEDVAHGDEPDIRAGLHRLKRRTCATVAAADHADLDGVRPGRMHSGGKREGAQGNCFSCGGGKESSAVGSGFSHGLTHESDPFSRCGRESWVSGRPRGFSRRSDRQEPSAPGSDLGGCG